MPNPDQPYGQSSNCGPKQPGGAMTRATAKRDASASPRLTYKGGNPPRKLNPFK